MRELRRILILCKTYPAPSRQYVETSCVAGIDEAGQFIRLFPVPFRWISAQQQFKKWQWILARVRKSTKDHRPESHVISVDTIEMGSEPLPKDQVWLARREVLQKIVPFDDFAALEINRLLNGNTLGLLKPSRILDLHIKAAKSPHWTADEIAKLMQAQNQGALFDLGREAKELKLLRKMPFDFHYVYECDSDQGVQQYKHKVVDWEICALFWKIYPQPNWQEKIRRKLVTEFSERDLFFLMGNQQRFPDQWLIVSLIYPPKLLDAKAPQLALF